MAEDMRRVDLFVVSDKESEKKPGSGTRIAIVQWVKDNKSVSVQLVKMSYWKNENDGQEYMKPKGFTHSELMSIFGGRGDDGKQASLWKEKSLGKLMLNPPEVKPVATRTQVDDGIEEVPF